MGFIGNHDLAADQRGKLFDDDNGRVLGLKRQRSAAHGEAQPHAALVHRQRIDQQPHRFTLGVGKSQGNEVVKQARELLPGAAQLERQRGIDARGEPPAPLGAIAAQTRKRVFDQRMQIERLHLRRKGAGGDRQQIVGVLKLTP